MQVAALFVGFLGAAASWYLFDSLERELAKREASLQEGKTRIQAVVDNAADGIITLDEAGNIESFNAAAERIFGWKAEQIIGSNLRGLIAKPGSGKQRGGLFDRIFFAKSSCSAQHLPARNCRATQRRRENFPHRVQAVSEMLAGKSTLVYCYLSPYWGAETS